MIAILALVVLGPKELPKVLRTLGRTLAKLRRMSTELRQQSGIDAIIRDEGLHEELATLRRQRGVSAAGMVDSFIESSSQRAKKVASLAAAATPLGDDPYLPDAAAPVESPPITLDGTPPDPAVEYPEAGCDAYGSAAEPAAKPEGAAEPEGAAMATEPPLAGSLP